MSEPVIKVEGLGKKYTISHEGTEKYTALRDVISEKTNDLLKKKQHVPAKEEFWALKDVSFEINKGEAVGIIGRNGAGKSTLLKILSRITEPTQGRVTIHGRVASLLEVGTGFHPELTGRENIFLNGTVLGMSRSEIKRKFDEIVDFSGVEKFLDTPVKRYSTGMYLRLAFAVAAHLEPEILIVDEVLAVGDAEFQKKCLGKMTEVSSNDGRTVLFVSHNMAAIRELCDRTMIIKNGRIENIGQTSEIIKFYLDQLYSSLNTKYYSLNGEKIIGDENVKLLEIKIVDEELREVENIFITSKIGIIIVYEIITDLYKPDLSFLLTDADENAILHSVHKTENYKIGIHKWVVWFPGDFLNNLEYRFLLGITTSNPVKIHLQYDIRFKVMEDLQSPTRMNNDYRGKYHGMIRPDLKWQDLDNQNISR